MPCFIRHKWNGCICEKCGKKMHGDIADAQKDYALFKNDLDFRPLEAVLTMHKWKGCTCEICGLVNPNSNTHSGWKTMDKVFHQCTCGKREKHSFSHKAVGDQCVRYCTDCGYERTSGGDHHWIGCSCVKCGAKKPHDVVACRCMNCGSEIHDFIIVQQTHTNDYEDRFRWEETLYRCADCGKEKTEERPL